MPSVHELPRRATSERGRHSLYVVACVVTAAVIFAASRNLLLTANWVGIWLFAGLFSTGTKGSGFLMFWLGLVLFFPSSVAGAPDFLDPSLVKGGFLVAFAVLQRGALKDALTRSKLFRYLFIAWLGWGIITYTPVFVAWLTLTVLQMPLFGSFDFLLNYSTSGLKSAFPALTSVIVIAVPLVGLRDPADVRSFLRAIAVGTAILLVLSLAQYLLGTRVHPTEYQYDTSRLVGFSIPDPNGYGRLLLMPMFVLLSTLVQRERRLPAGNLAIVFLGLMTLALTHSRGMYITFPAAVLALVVLNIRNPRTFLVAFAALAVSVVIVYGAGLPDVFSEGSERMSSDNVLGRIYLQTTILDILAASPWFGAFPGGYFPALERVGFDARFASAHSMTLQIAVEWGVPMAFVLWVALVGAAVQGYAAVRRASKRLGRAVDAATLATAITPLAFIYAVYGLNEIVHPDMVFMLVGMAIAARQLVRAAEERPSTIAERPDGASLGPRRLRIAAAGNAGEGY